MRWPSMSSSSQVRSRGQARASASWAISTTPASLVTRREPTSRSISCWWSGSAENSRRGSRARTGSPCVPELTSLSTRSRSTTRCSGPMPAYTASADCATAPRIPPEAV